MRKKQTKTDYDKINTLIGRDVTIEGGKLSSSETIRIDGTYIGDIDCNGSVCIGQTGSVKGNLKATNVLIGGSVEGNTYGAEEVHLTSTAKVSGDISCKSFIVDDGALFDGKCKMMTSNKTPQQQPKKEETKKS